MGIYSGVNTGAGGVPLSPGTGSIVSSPTSPYAGTSVGGKVWGGIAPKTIQPMTLVGPLSTGAAGIYTPTLPAPTTTNTAPTTTASAPPTTASVPAPASPTNTTSSPLAAAAQSFSTGASPNLAAATMSATIPSATSDPTYLSQIADIARQMADYNSQYSLGLNQYDQNYQEGLRNLGWNAGNSAFDPNNMAGLYGQDNYNTQNDFASRGVLHSGVFAKALSDLAQQYGNKKTSLDTGRQQFLDTQGLNKTNYVNQQDLAKQAALRDAVARIASQYGVSTSAVPGNGGA